MKHISSRIIAASILGLCVISSITPCTLAAMPVSTPVIGYKMQRTIGITVLPTLSIKNGTATVKATIHPSGNCEYDLTITLQKKGLIFWGDEESWTVSGSSAKTVSKTVSVSSGTYRVLVEGTVYDANGNEVDTVSETSDSVT